MSQNGNGQAPIKRWRMRQGMTQEQAAKFLDVHRITYIRLEGQSKAIGKQLARKVAAVTGQRPGDVIEEYDRKTRRVR